MALVAVPTTYNVAVSDQNFSITPHVDGGFVVETRWRARLRHDGKLEWPSTSFKIGMSLFTTCRFDEDEEYKQRTTFLTLEDAVNCLELALPLITSPDYKPEAHQMAQHRTADQLELEKIFIQHGYRLSVPPDRWDSKSPYGPHECVYVSLDNVHGFYVTPEGRWMYFTKADGRQYRQNVLRREWYSGLEKLNDSLTKLHVIYPIERL
jgi:hypothetical protein